tara:strand:+ start:1618 stop:2061 length:444 start_codon:yes stop_codon:yes gene_type:complete
MEIRALTGFDLETRQQYGRSYTPLNGTNTLLGLGGNYDGTTSRSNVKFDVDIPAYIPPQPLTMIDSSTGQKKVFTVQNAQQLAALIQQGFNLFQQIKGATGSKKVVVVRSNTQIPPPKTSGLNTNSLIGIGVAALIMISLFISVKNK